MEMISAMSKACEKEIPFKVGPRRDGDLAELFADTTKAKFLLSFLFFDHFSYFNFREVLGWEAKVSFIS